MPWESAEGNTQHRSRLRKHRNYLVGIDGMLRVIAHRTPPLVLRRMGACPLGGVCPSCIIRLEVLVSREKMRYSKDISRPAAGLASYGPRILSISCCPTAGAFLPGFKGYEGPGSLRSCRQPRSARNAEFRSLIGLPRAEWIGVCRGIFGVPKGTAILSALSQYELLATWGWGRRGHAGIAGTRSCLRA
jgi:hypothetical protein